MEVSASRYALYTDDELALQEYEEQFAHKERAEQYRKHVHRIAVAGIYMAGLLLYTMVLLRVWHFLTPTCLHWLKAGQLHDVERIIFSGLILSMATRYFKGFKIVHDE